MVEAVAQALAVLPGGSGREEAAGGYGGRIPQSASESCPLPPFGPEKPRLVAVHGGEEALQHAADIASDPENYVPKID